MSKFHTIYVKALYDRLKTKTKDELIDYIMTNDFGHDWYLHVGVPE